MINVSLLPVDKFIVVNKTILEDTHRKLLNLLYQPILGAIPINLYYLLWSSLDKYEIMTNEYNNNYLINMMKLPLDKIDEARTKLEAVGLIKTYQKKGEVNSYVYELYSPLSASEVFNHPILNVTLYNEIGKKEYDRLISFFKLPIVNLKGYKNITASFSDIFTVIKNIDYAATVEDIKKSSVNKFNIEKDFNFDLLSDTLPKAIDKKTFLKKEVKELITTMSFLYNIDEVKMVRVIQSSLNQYGTIDHSTFRRNCRDFYQFENGGKLPTLMLKTDVKEVPVVRGNNREKMVATFKTTVPFDFLRCKNGNTKPTSSELSLIEDLMTKFKLNPGVVNVLIDYVLLINNNRLTRKYVEAIASQWKRNKITSVEQAMKLAETEFKRISKAKDNTKRYAKSDSKTPTWFDKTIEEEESNEEEINELSELLNKFK